MDAEVIIAGGGPTGLMLAGELCLAGVRPLVLERRPTLRETPKAYGLSGQILRQLDHRGLLERFGEVGAEAGPAPAFPFGGLDVDLTPLADPPLRAMRLPQPRLERLLGEHAAELGVEIRRGHEVAAVSQDEAAVTVAVYGPDGPDELTAHHVVGCDGAHSRVRESAGIPFPGNSYPEVNRLGQVKVERPAELGIPTGFTRTERGVFAAGTLEDGMLLVQTTEDESIEYDDVPLTPAELRDSIRRVLGVDVPLGEPVRLSRYQFQARQAERYRDGRIMLAGDAAHQFPATGIGLNAGMMDAVNLAWKLAATCQGWAPAGLLDTYHDERHFAGERALLHSQAQVALRRGHDPAAEALRAVFRELLTDEQPVRRIAGMIAGTDVRYPMPDAHPLTGTFATEVGELLRTGRPVFLDLADRPDLRAVAEEWSHRIDIHQAVTADRPADAILIRPDAYIAWAAGDPETLRAALTYWFGPNRICRNNSAR